MTDKIWIVFETERYRGELPHAIVVQSSEDRAWAWIRAHGLADGRFGVIGVLVGQREWNREAATAH